jgi:hypothetical protein
LPVYAPRAFSNTAGNGHGAAPDHDADSIGFWRNGPATSLRNSKSPPRTGFLLQPTLSLIKNPAPRFARLSNTGLSAGHHVVSKTLSPSIIYLIELEISRQFLGKLECVNWSKPLTEHNRYAAVMLLSDVRRRLHYEMKDVDLAKKIYLDAQREFKQVQASIDSWATWIFGDAQMTLAPDDNSRRLVLSTCGVNGLPTGESGL